MRNIYPEIRGVRGVRCCFQRILGTPKRINTAVGWIVIDGRRNIAIHKRRDAKRRQQSFWESAHPARHGCKID